MMREPVLMADRRTKPRDQYASVVFPGGAVLHGKKWVVSMGIHDRWSELHSFGADEIESSLERIEVMS